MCYVLYSLMYSFHLEIDMLEFDEWLLRSFYRLKWMLYNDNNNNNNYFVNDGWHKNSVTHQHAFLYVLKQFFLFLFSKNIKYKFWVISPRLYKWILSRDRVKRSETKILHMFIICFCVVKHHPLIFVKTIPMDFHTLYCRVFNEI